MNKYRLTQDIHMIGPDGVTIPKGTLCWLRNAQLHQYEVFFKGQTIPLSLEPSLVERDFQSLVYQACLECVTFDADSTLELIPDEYIRSMASSCC